MHAESLFEAADLPFHRPSDYFAEMVKTDAHMAKIRQSLLDEQAGMKASDEARKLRDAKKFGKKVQVERLREREMEKKAVGQRLESLKKSASGPPLTLGRSFY
jgi:rRNA-processing protein EBP2